MPAVAELGRRARAAARRLAIAGSAARDAALSAAADLLLDRAPELLDANAADVTDADAAGLDPTPLDRLRVTDARLQAMADGLRQVAALPDPLGEVLAGWRRPNGLELRQVRVPLGVVAVIYENRPNVTSDAAAIAMKAGNAVLLRGSASAHRTNRVIADAVRDGLTKAGLPADATQLLDDPSHEAAVELMRLPDVDCLIPRGGHALIASVREHATVPVIIDGDGNCHVYVDAAADLDAARRFTHEVDAGVVIVNASTRFTDGERFGFGAEIGISTQKLHARGPMGLQALTTYRYEVWGDGQVVE